MNFTVNVPPIAETQITGINGSLIANVDGIQYEFVSESDGTSVYANDKFISRDEIEKGAVSTELLSAVVEMMQNLKWSS